MENISSEIDLFFKNIEQLSDSEDRAYGSVVGAFLGDSIGSYVEFEHQVSEDRALKALKMPGGGPFRLSPGQVTDDSELALSLARGLVESLENFDPALNFDCIAKYYGKWVASNPFDMGMTTRSALYSLRSKLSKQDNITGFAKECIENSERFNQGSESNGGLMRITPLAVYCAQIDDVEKVKEIVRTEQSLTHSNKTAQDAGISYVLAIRSLIREQGDVDKALDAAKNFIDEQNDEKGISSYWKQFESDSWMPGNRTIGWAKIAWSYSFDCLAKKKTFFEAMKEVLEQAGDTDTNCAIVGGMVGAALGLKKLCKEIPEQIEIFKNCRVDLDSCPRSRPKEYNPHNIINLTKRIIEGYRKIKDLPPSRELKNLEAEIKNLHETTKNENTEIIPKENNGEKQKNEKKEVLSENKIPILPSGDESDDQIQVEEKKEDLVYTQVPNI